MWQVRHILPVAPGFSRPATDSPLFNHPNVGPFIGRQLIQRLVTSNPSPAYVGRVTAAFNAAPRGDLGREAGPGNDLPHLQRDVQQDAVAHLDGVIQAQEDRGARKPAGLEPLGGPAPARALHGIPAVCEEKATIRVPPKRLPTSPGTNVFMAQVVAGLLDAPNLVPAM